MCDLYRCWVEEEDSFNCHQFSFIALYHTTTTNFDKCNVEKIMSAITGTDIIKLKAKTTNIDTFIQSIETLKNTMCQVKISDAHFIALEIRTNGFYIYNSWRDTFSNAWFSGLEKENKLFEKINLLNQKKFMNYKSECGMGRLLTKFALKNCFKILSIIAETYGSPSMQIITIDTLICRNLNAKFNALE
jgi:hypothetical protein